MLTAGHCVYDHKILHDWVGNMFVVPAQTDMRYPHWPPAPGFTEDSTLEHPFGIANVQLKTTFNEWINNQNLDYDMAWLTLDRRIGLRTGYGTPQTGVGPASVVLQGYRATRRRHTVGCSTRAPVWS